MSSAVLLFGQVLQGVMVGALQLSFILVRKHLSAGQSHVAIGLVVALFAGGGMAGTLIAGPLAEGLSWHWMFALPTITIIATTLAVTRWMPNDPPVQSDDRIDWPGVLLLSGTLLTLGSRVVAATGRLASAVERHLDSRVATTRSPSVPTDLDVQGACPEQGPDLGL